MTNRRQFIVLLGAAAAWPVAARAQQGERMRRVGWFTSLAADDPVPQAYIAALLQGLQELGWSVGRNVRIDYRWGASNAELKRRYAAELIALSPDVIVTTGDSNTAALLQATRTAPIVFVLVPDPVGAGFTASLARPGARQAFHRRRCASAMRARPVAVFGPVDSPPWKRHLRLPGSTLTAHGLPCRLRAPQTGRSFRGRGERLPLKPSAQSSRQAVPILQPRSEQVRGRFEAGQPTKP